MATTQTTTNRPAMTNPAIDVEVGQDVPEAAVDVQLRGQQAGDLDGADEEGHRDRQAR